MEEVINEYNEGVILKLVSEDGVIIGSVRARAEGDSVCIGKLMVHPDYGGRGYGTKLLLEIEKQFPGKRFELFTSTRSFDNIRLYQANGYAEFKRKDVTDELTFVYMEKK